MSKLTHLDDSGAARMVDISAKPATRREATAEGYIHVAAPALAAIAAQTIRNLVHFDRGEPLEAVVRG